MRTKTITRWAAGGLIISAILAGFALTSAAETLKYSSSAQVREAMGEDTLKIFTQKTGVTVNLFVGSSAAAVARLMNGAAGLASTVERLPLRHQEYGYVEIPFCKAPLVVITNVQTPVEGVSTDQLRAIFSGEINNWKELGGPDQHIVTIVPGMDTGAFKNFRQMALKRFDVKYDFMTYRSTGVVELVSRIPWSISFIAMGAPAVRAEIKTLKVDSLAYKDEKYPFFEVFSFISKGKPQGTALKLVEFSFSPEVREIILKNEMIPLERPVKLLGKQAAN